MGGVTNLMVPKCIPRILPNFVILIIVSSAMLCVLSLGLTLHNNDILIFWLGVVPFGVLFGVASVAIVSEMVILETQPKRHSGKVSAAKTSLKVAMRSFAAMLTGLFWFAISCIGVLIYALSMVMTVTACFLKTKDTRITRPI